MRRLRLDDRSLPEYLTATGVPPGGHLEDAARRALEYGLRLLLS